MHKLIPATLAMICCFRSLAQTNQEEGRLTPRINIRCAKVFFDLNTGINNNGGLLGIGTDVHVADDISFCGGLGLVTSWGFKIYGGIKCYAKPCHKGWALGCGITYSTGAADYRRKMETQSGAKEMVDLRLIPQANLYAALYHHWAVGHKNNRIYMQLGWSQPANPRKFEQLEGNPISSNAAALVRFVAPGGPVAGLGFSFGGK